MQHTEDWLLMRQRYIFGRAIAPCRPDLARAPAANGPERFLVGRGQVRYGRRVIVVYRLANAI